MCRNFEIFFLPPQFYEISRFIPYKSYSFLKSFAKERSGKGVTMCHPIAYSCTDGLVSVLPGKLISKLLTNNNMKIITICRGWFLCWLSSSVNGVQKRGFHFRGISGSFETYSSHGKFGPTWCCDTFEFRTTGWPLEASLWLRRKAQTLK